MSFRRKPESSKFNYFWMPDQVRHDGFGIFYETINLGKCDMQELFKRAVENHLKGDYEKALSLYGEVLEQEPAHALALNNTAVIYLSMNNNEKAIQFLDRAIQSKQDYPEALNNLATALKNQKRYDEALKALKHAIFIKPDFKDAYFNLGNTYCETGKYEEAVEAYNKSIGIDPNDHEVLNNLGSVFLDLGRFSEAENVFLESISIIPNHAPSFYNLGRVFMAEGNLIKALDAFRSAIGIDPGFSDAYLNIGILMADMEKMDEAIGYFQQAIKTNPKSPDAYYNLGLAFEMTGDPDSAIHVQESALNACPNATQSLVGGARIFMKIGDWKRVDPLINQLLNHDFTEDENALLSDCLIMFHYVPLSGKNLYGEHCLWGDNAVVEAKKPAGPNTYSFDGYDRGNNRIRIGYISPDFRRHSVGWFFEKLIKHHDRELFDIYCYSTGKRGDDLTRAIERNSSAFRKVHNFNTQDLADRIFKDRINILVDLAGHTKGTRLDVLAVRPAPIQVTAIGYPNGTGLPTMDYRITDHHAESSSSIDTYREKLIFLSRCFLPLGPFGVSNTGIKKTDFGLPEDTGVLISFNKAEKLRPEVLTLWDKILTKCPATVLALGCKYIDRGDLRSNIISYFSSRNKRDRIIFLAQAQTEELHRARYAFADLALDTFPYSGTTTSYEALRMNVPVITLVGDNHVQRTTYSILRNLGVEETIARSDAEYIEKTVDLIENPHRLRQVKDKLAKAFIEMDKTHPKGYTAELEKAFRIMWQRYEKGEPPSNIIF